MSSARVIHFSQKDWAQYQKHPTKCVVLLLVEKKVKEQYAVYVRAGMGDYRRQNGNWVIIQQCDSIVLNPISKAISSINGNPVTPEVGHAYAKELMFDSRDSGKNWKRYLLILYRMCGHGSNKFYAVRFQIL